MFRTVPLSINRSFSLHTQQWYMSYRFADSKPVWHIPLLCVQWKTPYDGQRNCPKSVEFHSKNKCGKLVHLVGFIIRNWSHERQMVKNIWGNRNKRRSWENMEVTSNSLPWWFKQQHAQCGRLYHCLQCSTIAYNALPLLTMLYHCLQCSTIAYNALCITS